MAASPVFTPDGDGLNGSFSVDLDTGAAARAARASDSKASIAALPASQPGNVAWTSSPQSSQSSIASRTLQRKASVPLLPEADTMETDV